MSKEIIITGASGWLGRETIAKLGYDNYRLNLFSSKRSTLNIGGNEFLFDTLENLDLSKKYEGFIHLAHRTMDAVKQLGQANYVYENLEITAKAAKAIEITRPNWVIVVSSGAIYQPLNQEITLDLDVNPYGFGKRIEELVFKDVCRISGSNLVIGRLWNTSGRFMIPNKAYAISDFIQSALKNRSINIQANHDVFRKYVDAGQFMDILIQLAQRKNNTVLNSGGYMAEIGEVAKLVSEKIGLTSILRPAYNGSPASNYFSNDNTFNLTAKKLGVHLLSLGEQIDLTLLGHREQLG